MFPRSIFCVAVLIIAAAVLITGCTTTSPGPATPAVQTMESVVTSPGPTSSATPAVTAVPTSQSTIVQSREVAQVTLSSISVPAGSIVRNFTYTLNGKTDSIPLALPTSVYNDYTKKAVPPVNDGNSANFLAYINDAEQQQYVTALANAIELKTDNPDDQARIAVSIVQHIPYSSGNPHRYPYEVLYNGHGVPGEKSMLLALLLRDLGFGSSVFSVVPEDRMATGISVLAPYDYKNTGYAFIDATEPDIITYDGSQFSFGTASSKPEVTLVGVGRQLSSVSADYNDAHDWTTMMADISHLSTGQRQQYDILDTKYDLSYFTCQECKIPTGA
jgi:hypothetical protein